MLISKNVLPVKLLIMVKMMHAKLVLNMVNVLNVLKMVVKPVKPYTSKTIPKNVKNVVLTAKNVNLKPNVPPVTVDILPQIVTKP